MNVRRIGGILVLFVSLTGCGSPAPSAAPTRSLGPGEQWLGVVQWGGLLCGGAGFEGEFRIHGSPDDPHLVWMTWPDGSRRELVWSPGTSARFTPSLEVVGPGGNVIAREGTMPTGGCPVGDPRIFFVELELPVAATPVR